MEHILSVDLGTSAIKVALFNTEGELEASSTSEFSLLVPSTLAVEMEVGRYWNAFRNGVHEVLGKSDVKNTEIKALGISAQGETLIVIDKSGKPLRNAIVWMDSRAQAEARFLSECLNEDDVYGISGQVSIVPTWPAVKVYWLKQHEPQVFAKVYKYLLIEDYFIYRLTGRFVAEGSLLCSTLYWDITRKVYWDRMLSQIGISANQLPDIVESGDVVGTIMPTVAADLGLSPRTVICAGLLDQAAGAIGVGNVKPGMVSECTGSALAIVATVEHPFKDPERRMPCHYHGLPNTYMAHTFTTGGMVLKWFRDHFCESEVAVARNTDYDPYYLMGLEATKAPPGCEGLLTLPHFQGAMAPENDPSAKGVFFGITLAHTRAHFVRSIMESIAFALKRNLIVLEGLGLPTPEIRSLGGGARSELWAQIKADVTKRPVTVTTTKEEACLGAAIVAGAGIGIFSSVTEASSSMVRVARVFEPNPDNAKFYDDAFAKYIELYMSLRPVFQK